MKVQLQTGVRIIDDSGDNVAESYADGRDAESQAEALADVQDKLAEKREEDSDSWRGRQFMPLSTAYFCNLFPTNSLL